MNGINNPIIFYPAAVVMILTAILAVKFKNLFYSLLCAIIVFFLAGMFFYVLGSEYNAVIQIAVYGVAVPVILGLGIMFTDTKNKEKNSESSLKYIMLLCCGIFILTLIYLGMTSLVVIPQGFNIAESHDGNPLGAMNAFSNGIFIKYVWAFELVSIILTIIVAGLTMFKKRERS